MSIPGESSGTRNAREVREALHQLAQQKMARWLAVVAIVVPLLISGAAFVWGASAVVSKIDAISSDISHEIEGLTREVSGLRADIGEIRGAQGAQALIVVKLEAEVGHSKEEIGRIWQTSTDTLWTVNNTAKYVATLRQQMDFIWVAQGFPPMTDKEDGP